MKTMRNDYCMLMFVGNDHYRQAMMKINSENGNVYATNGHIAAKIKGDLCIKKYEKIEKYPNVESVFSQHKPIEEKTFSIDDLFNSIMKIEVCFRPEKVRCGECEGDGELTCDHCDSEYECKLCRGDGEVNGDKLILSGENDIMFFNKKYNLGNFNKIINTAIFTNTKVITVSNGEAPGSIFTVGDFTILLMPLMMND